MRSIYDEWTRAPHEFEDQAVEDRKQAVLVSYLNGKATADDTVREWIKSLTYTENHSDEIPWFLLIDAAKEFPQAHRKLMELVDLVAQLPTTEEVDGGRFWLHVPEFLELLRDAHNSKGSVFAFVSYRELTVMSCIAVSTITTYTAPIYERRYINLSAFIAQVWHHQHGDWTNWAMEQSSNFLEDEHHKSLADPFGLAVAQLFLFSGSEMYASGNAAESSEYYVGSLLLKERETARVSRWEFWKRRFEQSLQSEILSEQTKDLFLKVLLSMAEVEVQML